MAVSLVSTSLGDNEAFGRVIELAYQAPSLCKDNHDHSPCILMTAPHIHVSPLFSSLMVSYARFDCHGAGLDSQGRCLALNFQGHCAMWQHVLRLHQCVFMCVREEEEEEEREANN